MKKIYFLLLAGLMMCVGATATTYYSRGTNNVNLLTNWNSNISGTGGATPTSFCASTSDTFIVRTPMVIFADSTWTVCGTVVIEVNAGITMVKYLGSGDNATLNFGKALVMNSNGKISTTAASNNVYLTVNLDGNLWVNNVASFFAYRASQNIDFHFNDATASVLAPRTISWTSTAISSRSSFTVDNGSFRRMISDMILPDTAAHLVKGSLDFGVYKTTGNTSNSFTIDDDANVYMKHANGIDHAVQGLLTKTFSPKAHYHYDGSVAQVTGITLPTAFLGNGSVTIKNTVGNVTLSQATTFDAGSAVNLDKGVFDNGSLMTMLNGSQVNVDAGNFATNPIYNALVDVTYVGIGLDTTALMTTGYELLPVALTTSIGNLRVNKFNFAGATHIVTLGSDVTVNGDVILDKGILDANLMASTPYTINAKGNWRNNAGTGAYDAAYGGWVRFNGAALQTLYGPYTTSFYNLELNNAAGAILADTQRVYGEMALNTGALDVDVNELILGADATITTTNMPTFDNNAKIIADDPMGHVRRDGLYYGPVDYFFPIGDAARYSPVRVTLIDAGSFGAEASLAVNVAPVKHPQNVNANNYLDRYWRISTLDISTPIYTVTATYDDADVAGDETKMSAGQYTGALPWLKYGPAVTVPNNLIFDQEIYDTYTEVTGITTAGPTVTAPANRRICDSTTQTTTLTATASTSPDLPLSYQWTPTTDLSTATGLVTTVIPTSPAVRTYTITVTDGNGFTGYATTTVTVDPAPTVLSASAVGEFGLPSACDGKDLYLTAVDPNNVATFHWEGPVAITYGEDFAFAQVSSVTPTAAGVYTLTLTNGTSPGCIAIYTTTPVDINPLPGGTILTTDGGATEFCLSTTINAAPAVTGETVYFQGITPGGVSFADAVGPDDQIITSTGTYYFRTGDALNGCWGPESSIAVTINPAPPQQNLIGGGLYCSGGTGVSISMENTDPGMRYYLYRMDLPPALVDSVDGSGGPETFGLFTEPGTYQAYAMNLTTGCLQIMNWPTVVTVDSIPLPVRYNLTGGGGYCISGPNSTGKDLRLDWSQNAISYQLYYRDNTMGATFNPYGTAIMGTNDVAFFMDGSYTGEGVYMVVATSTDGYGCTDTMATTDSIWVNPLPNVYSMSGVDTAVCQNTAGVHIKLGNSGNVTVRYQLFEDGAPVPAPPIFGNSGVIDFGIYPTSTLTAGVHVYTVEAADGNNCYNSMAGSITVTVNPAPTAFTISNNAVTNGYCDYAPIAYDIWLEGSEPGINYDLLNSGLPTGDIANGDGDSVALTSTTTPGFYTISATNPVTGCVADMNGYTQIAVYLRPEVDTMKGGGHYCDGVPPGVPVSSTYLNAINANVQYLLYNEGSYVGVFPTNDFSNQMAPGWYTAIARDMSNNCETPVYDSVQIIIDSLPRVYSVIGGGEYCVNDTTARAIGLSGSQTSIEYKLYRDVATLVDSFAGTGSVLGFGTTVITGNYTVIATNEATGCVSNMLSSASVIAQPIPVAYNVTGGGRYCEGSGGPAVDLENTESADINYQLYRNGTIWGSEVTGTGSTITFGAQDSGGVYTVRAKNTITGCLNNMDSFAFVVVKPIPVQFTVAGAGPYCAGDTGRHVYLSGSLVGTKYQLYMSGTPMGTPVAGTGFGLDFGLFTGVGTYYVIAELDADSCQRNMIGAVNMSINALPPVYAVSGGGTICADSTGTSILLADSDPGVRYQLYRGTTPVGTGIDGTGANLTFAPYNVAGTYSIVGTDLATACASSMTGAATVSVNPLPAIFNVTGGGDYCDGDGGLVIGLDGSQMGLIYQLYTGGIPVGAPALGLGTPLNFGLIIPSGIYYAKALNTATGCKSNMGDSATIIINALPDSFTVTGGGAYCQGGTGMPVFLAGSTPGVEYQLYAGTVASGIARPGTGTVIHFGPQTLDSTYTVVARDTTTGCINSMSGNATIEIIPFVAPTVTLNATPGTMLAVGQMDTVVASVSGGGPSAPTYAWRINRNPVPGANTNTLVFMMYFDNDTIECDVTSTGECAGITTTKQIIIHLKPVGVKELASLNGSIRLVPNPNKGMFSLKGNIGTTTDVELDVEVTNMLGQVVYRSKMMTRNGDLDEQIQLNGNLANGMYLLNLRSEHASGVFHFVVEQ